MAYFYNPETGQKGEYDPAQFPGGLPPPYQEIDMTPEEYAAYLASLGVKPTGETGGTLDPYVQSLYDDLFKRGGTWEQAAKDFLAALTTGGIKAGDNNGAYQIYLEIHRKYSGGGTISTGGAEGGKATWPTGEFAASFPQAAWEKAFGLPSFGQNPFQQWLASQAAPSYAAWLGKELMPGATVPGTFESFLSQGGRERAGGMGLEALRQAKGLVPEEQERWLSELGGAESGIASLSALMRAALGAGGRGFATPVANIMAGRLGGLQGAWLKETGAGATGPTFLDFLMQKYGLG